MATIDERLHTLGLEILIWVETHVELNTLSKMFCACANGDTDEPNINICPMCTWQLGVLPMPNKAAIAKTITLWKAIQWDINHIIDWDRKHYEYPDLPKWYQLTQLDNPIVLGGNVSCFRMDGTSFDVQIDHIHLEEDTGKLVHIDNHSLIDYTRSWRALIEIVSKPCIHSVEDMGVYFEYVQKIARAVDVSDADMEKGHIRSDISISLRKKWSQDLNPRTEIKNMNSFKFAKDAATSEIENQLTYWETNSSPKQEQVTALWDVKEKQIKVMRNKENAQDYRYIKEPDIPAIDISSLIDEIHIDENLLPYSVEKKLIAAGIHPKDSKYFSADRQKAMILFAVAEKTDDLNTTAKALLNGFTDPDFSIENIQPIADIILYYKKWDYSGGLLKKAVSHYLQHKSINYAEIFVEEKIDDGLVTQMINESIAAFPDVVEKIKAGDAGKANLIVGDVMKKLQWKARGDVVKAKVHEILGIE